MYWTPGPLNSNLISTEKAVPNSPEKTANIRYNIPISLAFEDKNHLSVHSEILDFNVCNLFKLSFLEKKRLLSFIILLLYKLKEGC